MKKEEKYSGLLNISIALLLVVALIILSISFLKIKDNEIDDSSLNSLNSKFNLFSFFKNLAKQTSVGYSPKPIGDGGTCGPGYGPPPRYGCDQCLECDYKKPRLRVYEFLGWDSPYRDDDWWCPPCKALYESHAAENLINSYKNNDKGTVELFLIYVHQMGLPPSYYQGFKDVYGVSTVPALVLVDLDTLENGYSKKIGNYGGDVNALGNAINNLFNNPKGVCKKIPDEKKAPCIVKDTNKNGICVQGVCRLIECTEDKHCGTPQPKGNPFCSGENIVQKYTKPTCDTATNLCKKPVPEKDETTPCQSPTPYCVVPSNAPARCGKCREDAHCPPKKVCDGISFWLYREHSGICTKNPNFDCTFYGIGTLSICPDTTPVCKQITSTTIECRKCTSDIDCNSLPNKLYPKCDIATGKCIANTAID